MVPSSVGPDTAVGNTVTLATILCPSISTVAKPEYCPRGLLAVPLASEVMYLQPLAGGCAEAVRLSAKKKKVNGKNLDIFFMIAFCLLLVLCPSERN